MLAMVLTGRFLLFFFLTIVGAAQTSKSAFNCKGGSIYFAAHPADVLLYQNPDIFRDLYVFKCTTVVLFTSGDRGMRGNYSRSVERGLEDAFAWMTGQESEPTSWSSADAQFDGQVVQIRTVKDRPTTQLVYLRLPNSAPDGQAYPDNDGQSLKKLYNKDSETLHTLDGSATYTLDDLKDLISAILRKREANDIRILDQKTAIPQDGEKGCDHADHTISARLVAEVAERDKLKGYVQGYACGSMRNLDSTLTEGDMRVKIVPFFKYAAFDNSTCQSYAQCKRDAEEGASNSVPDNDDTQYIVQWLEREYYVQ